MSSQFWMTILGGFIAAATGALLFFVQRKGVRKDAKEAAVHEALREFRESLMPLLIELNRWHYQPEQESVWVGASRELPSLGTWIFDPEENVRKAPDWDSIGRLAQEAERLWRDRLSWRSSAPTIDSEWIEASRHLFHVTRKDGADPRAAAERAETHIMELLAKIHTLLAEGPESKPAS